MNFCTIYLHQTLTRTLKPFSTTWNPSPTFPNSKHMPFIPLPMILCPIFSFLPWSISHMILAPRKRFIFELLSLAKISSIPNRPSSNDHMAQIIFIPQLKIFQKAFKNIYKKMVNTSKNWKYLINDLCIKFFYCDLLYLNVD